MPMIQGIIWDLDGVLIDSEAFHIQSEIELFRSFGATLTPEIAREYLGYTLADYLKALIERLDIKVPLEEMLAKHKKTQEYYYGHIFPLASHAHDVLSKLSPDYVMGLATSALRPMTESVLKRFSLTPYFSAITCGDEVEHGKPDPEIFLKTASKLNLDPQKMVVIEDAASGIKAAKSAGMRVIGRRTNENRNQDLSAADLLIEDMMDIPSSVQKLKSK